MSTTKSFEERQGEIIFIVKAIVKGPIQRFCALVCFCMRLAPQLRLVEPWQRRSLQIYKNNTCTMCLISAFVIIKVDSAFLHRTQDPIQTDKQYKGKGAASRLKLRLDTPSYRWPTIICGIIIVKMQGGVMDTREAWVTLPLAGEKKPHLSRH